MNGLTLGVLIYFFTFSPAHAYLDPGTGSLILNSIIGAIGGLLVLGKLYWVRIKAYFSKVETDETKPHEASQDDDQRS